MSADGTSTLPPPPPLSDCWALFLDVDGTLVEFADHPERVVVPAYLVRRLDALAKALDGALALVSGRRVETLDRLFDPLRLPAAGLHGLQRRCAGRELPPERRERWRSMMRPIAGSDIHAWCRQFLDRAAEVAT